MQRVMTVAWPLQSNALEAQSDWILVYSKSLAFTEQPAIFAGAFSLNKCGSVAERSKADNL